MRPAPKKAAVPDSSSDDDDAPVRKPAQKAKASPAMRPAPKKTPRSECCGEQEPIKKSVRTEVVSAGPGGKEWEDNNVNNTGKSNGNGGTALRRFQRIDPTKVVFVKNELRDNRPGGEHMAFRQNQEMMRVKGKNFNKLKQKNKAKFYAAGVDTSVRSFQFDDSD
ncbi:hypothetical protein TcBrA4_0020270 [Trypanosoma cruzi]|nr:hypothetical protein TcBrA4_0020270 [Trypanosoma cruzi]